MWITDECGALHNLAHARNIVPTKIDGKFAISVTWVDAKPLHFWFKQEKERDVFMKQLRMTLRPQDFF